MSSEPLFPDLAEKRTTSDKIAASILALSPIVGGVASLFAVVVVALLIALVRYFLGGTVPTSAWIAAIVIVVGNDISSSINRLKKDK